MSKRQDPKTGEWINVRRSWQMAMHVAETLAKDSGTVHSVRRGWDPREGYVWEIRATRVRLITRLAKGITP